jgi:Asp/Glu/hydantoin racemase
MQRILIINPNTNAAMTAAIGTAASRHAGQRAEIDMATGRFGLSVVATRAGYAIAAHAALDAYAACHANHDVVVIACFGDPGLEALREVASCPVSGLAEASIHAADAASDPFAIVTVGPAWVEMLEERIRLASPRARCVGVFAMEGSGLDFAGSPDAAIAALDMLAAEAVAAGARTLILGGAALAGLGNRLGTPARYIDCVDAAVSEAIAGGAPIRATRTPQAGTPNGMSAPLEDLLVKLGR